MTRVIIAALISLALALLSGPFVIAKLRALKMGQQVRDDGPQSHLSKQGTPTMGGIMILACVIVSTVICSINHRIGHFTLIALVTTAGYGAIGFLDDYVKLMKKRSLGLRAWQKIALQIVFAALIAIWLRNLVGTVTVLPFVKQSWDMGPLYIPFVMFVLLAMTNSANLLDGLDGLLSSVTAFDMVTLLGICAGLIGASEGMENTDLTNAAVFTVSVAGACLGFLRFNRHPAKVFMGDTGSMALGGAVTISALLLRVPLILPMIALMMVLSSVSDIIQIGSYKLRKKRVFRMAPLHHHFELGGHSEQSIVFGYSVVTLIMCLIAVFSL